MAQNTGLTPYDEPIYGEPTIESLDEFASGAEFMAYSSTPSMAKKDYSLPEDIPLFLSNDAEEPRQRGFGSGGEKGFDRAVDWSRFVKAGILVASAAGIAFAIASVENPLALFSNAKASLIGAAPAQSSAAAGSASEPVVAARAVAAQPAPVSQPAAAIGASPPAARAPTRDEIALALKAAAHQSQPEIRQPAAAAAAPPPPTRRLDAEELATLLKRARSLIEIGDIAPARLLLERAADAHEASAALMLAQTYDPAVLGTPDTRSITPDPAKAREWYRKAAQFGSQDAQQRLSQIQN
ncbi:hypothetical protein KMZ68_01480 [Bradyrhizobium sediminis]|uniref:Sel1 repeat family protein n=1 Tax=Bradyrhizobium sediminis TaxID=2840469 RepID=A0A975RT10_9BRAD|nr:hypothetical protein [Bradyrhizobium sediminis]QWG18599.1 hypothetical protein KMZ68_01480 [Bradyrhizobium sediminis]